MKLKTVILIVLALVLITSAIMAQTLPVDSRKKEMQFSKSFTALRYSPEADTLWHRITLPARTIEVWAIADSGAVAISPDSLYYKTAKPYAYVPAGVPFKLPTYKNTTIWIKRAASATVSHVNFIFMRM